jgi:tetratricopeptide (TPR) repeat protein
MGFFDSLFGGKSRPASRGPNVDKLLHQAKAFALAGEHADAAREFARALAVSPDHAEARYAFARSLARAGDRARAADELVESLRYSGEVEEPEGVLADAEALGISLSESHRRRIAAALTAGVAEGRFVFLHQEPFDEDAPPFTPERFILSVSYRQVRDLAPHEAALSLMLLQEFRQREAATALLIEKGFDAFLAHYGTSFAIPGFLSCYKLADLRKYLRRTAVNPVRGVDELFYSADSVAAVDPLRRSIPLIEDRPVEEAVLRWFAFKVEAPVAEWPDRELLSALAATYRANGDAARAARYEAR